MDEVVLLAIGFIGFILFVIYIGQLSVWYAVLDADMFETKKEALFYTIPIIPIIVWIVKKIKVINNKSVIDLDEK